MIIGAGAPTIQNVTTDAPAQITASATTANTLTLTALANAAIAHVALDVVPAAETGASTLSTSFTVQTRGLGRIYVVIGSSVRVFDQTGTELHPTGSFGNISSAAGITYNSSNGLLYIADQGQAKLLAYDVNGNAQTLSGNPSGYSNIAGLTYDAHNGLIYAAGQSVAFDANGNPTALSGSITFGYGISFDSVNDHIVTRDQVFDESGNQLGGYSFPGSPPGTADGAAFDAANDLIYVSNVYPTSILAYDTSGNAASISGNFAPLTPASSSRSTTCRGCGERQRVRRHQRQHALRLRPQRQRAARAVAQRERGRLHRGRPRALAARHAAGATTSGVSGSGLFLPRYVGVAGESGGTVVRCSRIRNAAAIPPASASAFSVGLLNVSRRPSTWSAERLPKSYVNASAAAA